MALAGALLCMTGAAAAASDGSALAGRWVGEMNEPGADVARYEIRLSFGTDRTGAPVGMVHYGTLNCGGVWIRPSNAGASWRFQEVITDDARSSCAPENDVEVSSNADSLTVRFMEPGQSEVIATATLRRVH
jgi:hypothetical protein